MKHYAGIDVSLECSSVCVVDADGGIVREDKVLSEPDALVAWFAAFGAPMERIGLEAGPSVAMAACGRWRSAGLAVELLETRHVRAAFRTMPVKTDKKDARGIAQLMRLGWFRPVHCKSLAAQEVRAVLAARKLLQSKLNDVEMSICGESARLRTKGRTDDPQDLRGAGHGPDGGPPHIGGHRHGAVEGAGGLRSGASGL